MRERSSRPGRKYAAIPNDAMRDIRVTIEARGVLALLMTYAEDWQFNKTHLLDVTGLGVNKFARVMKELEDAGYLELRSDRNEKGQLLGRTWIIKDEAEATENRVSDIRGTEATENRTHGKPNARKTTPIRRPIPSLKKTNLQENEAGDLFGEQEATIPEAKIDDRFDAFWAAYPKKSGKPNAKAAWDKAIKDGADPEAIILGARRYAWWLDNPAKGEFRPHPKYPQGWINGKRWLDDEIQSAPVKATHGAASGSTEAASLDPNTPEGFAALVEERNRIRRSQTSWMNEAMDFYNQPTAGRH